MILTASDVSALSNALSWWERGEYFFSFIVAAACFGEYAADFRPKWYRTGNKERDEKRKEAISKISTLVLVAALVFELVCVVRSNTVAGKVIGSINDLATNAAWQANTALDNAGEANKSASNALSLAQGARREADSFEKDIVSAKTQAADAESRLADALQRTARLEQQLSWRTVTPEQAKAIKDFLAPFRLGAPSPFRGAKVAFSYWSGDSEASEYAEELATTLRSALDGSGAEISDPEPLEIFRRGPPPKGVAIQVKSADNVAAGLLQRALKNAGIDAPGEIDRIGPDINLFIGVKPESR